MLTYLAIADKYRPKWLVWENVPGVLSSNGGHDFASFLRGLGELGYGFAYRVLDAQYFGVAQRRRRVFVVGYLGDWRRAAAVLFERDSLSGNSAPSREKREGVAPTVTNSPPFSRTGNDRVEAEAIVPTWWDGSDFARTITTKSDDQRMPDKENAQLVMQPIAYNITFCDANGTRSDRPNGGLYVSETDVSSTMTKAGIGTNVAQPMPINTMVALRHEALGEGTGFGIGAAGDPAYTITKGHSHAVAQPTIVHGTQDPCVSDIAFAQGRNNGGENVLMQPMAVDGYNQTLSSTSQTIRADKSDGDHVGMVMQSMAVRRLTPVECERLQGFPDTYTDIKSKGKATPDGPRYKALGNSMAVPVMAWIGKRINEVEELCKPNK
jgi:DNA (cytosine-5)-methyltransferase 1